MVRIIELYLGSYLVGKEFPPDMRLFPKSDDCDITSMTHKDI